MSFTLDRTGEKLGATDVAKCYQVWREDWRHHQPVSSASLRIAQYIVGGTLNLFRRSLRKASDERAFQRHPDESARTMKIPYVAMRIIAWAGVIGLAVASWTPGQEMIRTGFDTRLEHTTAYLMAGIAVLAAYPQKPPWLIAVLLGVYAGVLELGQMYVPGRHAALLDWLASFGGVVCAYVTVFFYRSRTRSPK